MRRLWAATIRLMLVTAVAVVFCNAVILGLRFEVYGIIALLGITYRLSRKRWQVSGVPMAPHGRSGLGELIAGNLLCERGLILGRVGHAIRPI